MKWIGDKISYEKHDDFLTIIITGKNRIMESKFDVSMDIGLVRCRYFNFIFQFIHGFFLKGNNGIHTLFLPFGSIFFVKY